MRLCVVALNPAIDAEWRVDDVLWEEKNVVHSQRRWPGGKGPNVARWLKFFGTDSELLIPLGGVTGREMASGLRAWRDELRESPIAEKKSGTHEKGSGTRVARPSIPNTPRLRIIPLREETRVNVVVTTARGRQMRFNPPGPVVSAREWQKILRSVQQVLKRGASLVLSGALPRGIPPNAYAQLIEQAHLAGRQTFLDCDGAALAIAVKAKPFFVKPNLHELSGWAGRSLRGQKATVAAARALSRVTEGWVLVSLGEEGALLVNARENYCECARAPRVQVLNTVGAGDAMLAGAATAVGRGEDASEWLRAAVAAGTAATQSEAGRLPLREVLRALRKSIR